MTYILYYVIISIVRKLTSLFKKLINIVSNEKERKEMENEKIIGVMNELPITYLQSMALANREHYVVEDGRIVRIEKNETN